jgi:hypothetical protein
MLRPVLHRPFKFASVPIAWASVVAQTRLHLSIASQHRRPILADYNRVNMSGRHRHDRARIKEKGLQDWHLLTFYQLACKLIELTALRGRRKIFKQHAQCESQCVCCLKRAGRGDKSVPHQIGEEEHEEAKGGLHPAIPLPLGKMVAILSFFSVIHSVNCSHSCKKN